MGSENESRPKTPKDAPANQSDDSGLVGTAIGGRGEVTFDFSESRGQLAIITGVRLGFLLAILVITIVFQALQPAFVNIDVLLPVYVLMAFAFALNVVYLFFFEEALKLWLATAFLFFFDSILISFLIHFTGVNQSIFLFLYLVNIILCGLVFKRRGAVMLALWTSVLFSLLMILGPEVKGQTLILSVGLNNLAFFAVAVLSGFLSEQLNFMGKALRKQGRDIRALRDLNSLIIDNIATGLITLDKDGGILLANRAALEILDRDATSVGKSNLQEILPGLIDRVRVSFAAPEHSLVERFDHVYQDISGNRLTLEVIVSALPVDNAIDGFIITFQDLTKIRRLEFQMRQSEKMAAVGQLAAGIAHEIRNPLASISGSIQLLNSAFGTRLEEETKLMNIVLREIDRLNNLVTEFLDFVRPDTLKDEKIDVNQLIRDVTEFAKLNRNLRQNVPNILNLQATHEIAGNRDKLKQALLNIIINAYQAMSESAEPELSFHTYDAGNKVVIKIKDRGCGIDEASLRKIFEPFHTTKPKGTGLGLAVTHKIIENHGGRVFVESAKGAGTEFTMEFPARASRDLDENALADSQRASENFAIAFRGQKRGNG